PGARFPESAPGGRPKSLSPHKSAATSGHAGLPDVLRPPCAERQRRSPGPRSPRRNDRAPGAAPLPPVVLAAPPGQGPPALLPDSPAGGGGEQRFRSGPLALRGVIRQLHFSSPPPQEKSVSLRPQSRVPHEG